MQTTILGQEDLLAIPYPEAESSERLASEPVVRSVCLDAFPESELPSLLGESLWDRLPWSELPPGKLDRATLVQAYNASLERLDSFKQDVTTLLTSACRTNLEFRQAVGRTHEAARDQALESELQAMLSRANWKQTPQRSIIDADVVSQATRMLRRQLNAALSQAIDQFTAEFQKLLDRLVSAKLIGRIVWKPNHCCGYDFFKQVVVQENQGPRQSKETINNPDASRQFGETIVSHEVTTRVHGEGRHVSQREEHEHVVINAVRTSIRESQVVMPPAVVELTNHVPEWLYSFVQVVDGDLCTESIETHSGKSKAWQDVSITRRPIYGWEPAVIIGPYVLTGWGPREVAAELARRDAVAAREHAESFEGRLPWLAAGLLSLAALFLWWKALQGTGGTFFALLSLVAAWMLIWQAVFDREVRRRNASAAVVAFWQSSVVGFSLLTISDLIARFYLSAVPIWLLCFLLGVCGVLWMSSPETIQRHLKGLAKS